MAKGTDFIGITFLASDGEGGGKILRFLAEQPKDGGTTVHPMRFGQFDLAKNVYRVHGADGAGPALMRRQLRREQVLEFFGRLCRCVVAMEACSGAHFWGHQIAKLGHEVRLIPPAYVKPFLKRQKNDMADAEAICDVSSPLHGDQCAPGACGVCRSPAAAA